MQLTRHTDYAVRTLIFLAAGPADELVQIKRICEVFDISVNHLSKVVNELVNKGYVESQRGRGGGIRLGKPAEEVNIGDVVRAMEPSLNPIDCQRLNCALLPNCRFKSILADASAAFIETIDGYTLSDLVDTRAQALRGL